jgi:hypothetical protein
MVLGAVVAAALGGGATPSIAASVTARSGETVAREAPDGGQAGIAVIRGSDRVRLLAEREDWSEIQLPDGRRAWVPTAEVTRVEDPPRDPPRVRDGPVATAVPTPLETPVAAERSTDDLGAEIDRLRSVIDELSRRQAAERTPEKAFPDDTILVIAGAALLVGIILGSAWERRRSRRDRSLKF